MNSRTRQRVARELAQELIQRDGEIRLYTGGASMGATLRDGDQILVRRTAPEDLKPGHLLVWRTADVFAAHRILYSRTHGHGIQFVTKGDNCLLPDPPVSSEKVVGRVVAIRGSGRAVSLDSPRERLAAACLLHYGRFVAAIGTTAAKHTRQAPGALLRLARKLLLLPALALGHRRGTV